MNESFFEKRGIAYRVNAFQRNRPFLVFIHGLSGSASAWAAYETVFISKYNLLTLDLRGHGRSMKPQRYGDYALSNAAEDVYELLQELCIERCVLISHSYGTLVALEFLKAHPEKVSRAVFLSPTAFLNKTRWSFFINWFGVACAYALALFPFRTHRRGRVDYTPYVHTSDWDISRIFHDIQITTLRVYLFCLAQAYTNNYDMVWPKISVPVLIIHGAEDSIVPVQHAIELHKIIPDSKLIVLEHSNHILVLDNEPELAAEIEQFVSEQ